GFPPHRRRPRSRSRRSQLAHLPHGPALPHPDPPPLSNPAPARSSCPPVAPGPLSPSFQRCNVGWAGDVDVTAKCSRRPSREGPRPHRAPLPPSTRRHAPRPHPPTSRYEHPVPPHARHLDRRPLGGRRVRPARAAQPGPPAIPPAPRSVLRGRLRARPLGGGRRRLPLRLRLAPRRRPQP